MARFTVGPGTKAPDALIDDASTERVAEVPATSPCRALTRSHGVGVAVPLTAVMTSATLRTCEAGVSAGMPLTSTPAFVACTVYPRWVSAAAVASDCAWLICR